MSDDTTQQGTPNPADTNPAAGAVTPPAAPQNQDPATAPLHKGLIGEITDPKELANYTKSLESKLVELTLASQAKGSITEPAQSTPPAPAKKSIEEEIEDEIFTNPKGAIKKLNDHILNKVNEIQGKTDQVKQFWNDFYEENPDLKGLDSVVKVVEAYKSAELRPLSITAARKKLSEEVRKHVKSIEARKGVTTEEMPQGGATILGSGGSQPGGSGKPAGKILSFADEMRQFQRSRGQKR